MTTSHGLTVYVTMKAVPDISMISMSSWNKKTGTLNRSGLPVRINPRDIMALGYALDFVHAFGHKDASIKIISMGPGNIKKHLMPFLHAGAHTIIHLCDSAFAGSDTYATAFYIAKAITHFEKENKKFIVISGSQSPDGDTAQVPPQLSVHLGASCIPACIDFDTAVPPHLININNTEISLAYPEHLPAVLTVEHYNMPPGPLFSRMKHALHTKMDNYIHLTASDLGLAPEETGRKLSKTRVVSITSPETLFERKVEFVDDNKRFIDGILDRLYKQTAQKPEHRTQNKLQAHENKAAIIGTAGKTGPSTAVSELYHELLHLNPDIDIDVILSFSGNDTTDLRHQAGTHGITRVFLIHQGETAYSHIHEEASCIASALKEGGYKTALFPADAYGRILAPLVAAHAGCGLTADCTGLSFFVDTDSRIKLLQTRPALGGNIMAAIKSINSDIEMATVRPGTFKLPESIQYHESRIFMLKQQQVANRTQYVPTGKLIPQTGVSHRKLVIGIGGGYKGTCSDDLLRQLSNELASLTNAPAAIGGSRKAVEQTKVGKENQIGQTGFNLQSDVYIALGISGAIQHIAGIRNSAIIAAVNKDKNAPIFQMADIGLIGDVNAILPALTQYAAERNKDGN